LQAIVGIKWEPTSLSLGLFQPWLAGGLSPTLLVSDKSLLSDSYSKKSLPLFARAGFSIQSKRDTDNLINKLGVSVGYQRIITSYGYSLKGDNIFTSVLLFY